MNLALLWLSNSTVRYLPHGIWVSSPYGVTEPDPRCSERALCYHAGMSTPKRIHYVPAGYQRAWAAPNGKGKQVWVYWKDGKPPRPQSPRDTALEKERHPPTFEEFLQPYDSDGVAALRTVYQKEAPPEEATVARDILRYIALLMTRTVASEREVQKTLEVAAIEFGQFMADDEATWEKTVEFLKRENPDKDIDFEEMRALGRNFGENFTAKVDPKKAMHLSLIQAGRLMPFLSVMGWNLMKAGRGRFITSDHPVVSLLLHPDGSAQFGGGIGLVNGRIFFPVSPKHCLVLSHRPQPNFLCPVSPYEVDRVNHCVAACAESILISEVEAKSVAKLAETYKNWNAASRLDERHLRDMFGVKFGARV